METLILTLSIAAMLLALVAVLLPVLPGLAIIWLIIFGYGLHSEWHSYGAGFVLLSGFLAVVGMVLDQVAGAVGAKKFGAGYPGMIGAFAGAVVGLIVLNIPGLVLGTFAGALTGELMFGKGIKASAYAGLGALLGFVTGALGKFILGLIMTGCFIYFTVTAG